MAEYQRAQKAIKDHKNELCREALKQRRATLLTEGQLSAELKSVLQVTWTWYCKKHGNSSSNECCINSLDASKLWYLSGVRLSHLRDLLAVRKMEEHGKNCGCENPPLNDPSHNFQFTQCVTFNDFLDVVQNVVNQLDATLESKSPFSDSTVSSSFDSTFQVSEERRRVFHCFIASFKTDFSRFTFWGPAL